jgi:hypothetical protein
MTARVEDRILDSGLTVLDTETTHISVCSSEPTSYLLASSTALLGFKSATAGGMFNAPTTVAANTREVASVAVSDGAITTSGTASWWAAYSTAGAGTLHAHGTLSGAQVVTAANSFTLASFTIRIPNQ